MDRLVGFTVLCVFTKYLWTIYCSLVLNSIAQSAGQQVPLMFYSVYSTEQPRQLPRSLFNHFSFVLHHQRTSYPPASPASTWGRS